MLPRTIKLKLWYSYICCRFQISVIFYEFHSILLIIKKNTFVQHESGEFGFWFSIFSKYLSNLLLRIWDENREWSYKLISCQSLAKSITWTIYFYFIIFSNINEVIKFDFNKSNIKNECFETNLIPFKVCVMNLMRNWIRSKKQKTNTNNTFRSNSKNQNLYENFMSY